MLAVSCSEGIHDIAVSIRCELLCKLLLAFLQGLLGSLELRSAFLYAYWLALLLRIEAEVLKQECLTWLEGGSLLRSVCAVSSKLHLYTKTLRNLGNNL